MIEGLKPYPEYKESGQEWLGDVPKHWELSPGHAAFDKRKIPNHGLKENTVLSLSYGRIKIKPTDKQHGLVPESYETYQIVDEGNIIIRGTDLQNDHTSLRIGLVRNRGIISSAYLCLQCRDTVTPEYGYQILNTFDLTKAIYRYGSGLRQNLDHGEIKRLPIFLPPVSEQAAIVRFLDHWNGRLEKAIRSKRRVIALLQEQKQAIIHRAVTRGLVPHVKLKDSGIPWLGEIPVHWEIWPLKRLGWFKGGAGFPISAQAKSGLEIPFLKVSDMTRAGNERWIESSNNTISKVTAKALGAHIFPENTIIFPKVGGAMLTNKRRLLRRPSCIDNNVMGCVISRGDLKFVFLLMQQLDLGRLSKPGPVPAISEGEVRQIKVVYPPVEEQMEIVTFLAKETVGLDTAIARFEREVTLLREYRTRLTADVVTGKLDVRAAAAQLPEEAEDEPLPDPEIPEEETETEEFAE
jgi:type I restriction enzyme S subunit